MPQTDAPTILFKTITDKTNLSIINEEHDNSLVEISGYGLSIDFNMEYINSIEDVEMAVGGISDLFRRLIMESLLKNKQNP